MIRKCVAVATLALVGILSAPGTALAYTAPEEPTIELTVDPGSVDVGELVPFLMEKWMPNSEGQFSVSADGVDGSDIGLTVLGSASIAAAVDSAGTFSVGVVFPAEAVYTIAASGVDTDGNPKTVSMRLPIGQGAGGSGGGNGSGSGLPNTGFNGTNALFAGASLLAVGAGVILLSRRSTARESANSDA